jgi:hypothetical protein
VKNIWGFVGQARLKKTKILDRITGFTGLKDRCEIHVKKMRGFVRKAGPKKRKTWTGNQSCKSCNPVQVFVFAFIR